MGLLCAEVWKKKTWADFFRDRRAGIGHRDREKVVLRSDGYSDYRTLEISRGLDRVPNEAVKDAGGLRLRADRLEVFRGEVNLDGEDRAVGEALADEYGRID